MRDAKRSSFEALAGTSIRFKVVDVGANPIDLPPYANALRLGKVDVVGFEPNLEALATLNAAKGPCETYLPYAIGDGARHRLHICQAPGMTSLLAPNPAVLALFHAFTQWAEVVATEEVQTVRLDEVAETEGVDFIKLDIQGAELMALRHGEARLRGVLVVQAEVEFLPIYAGQPLFPDVDAFLRDRGFMFHRFYPLTSRVVRPMLLNDDIFAGLGQAVWADAVFLRDLTRLDLLSDQQLLKTAAIMHDCYGSIDVTLHLLGAHDRRSGGSLSRDYLASLKLAWTED